jgi:hypothetical protein
MVVVVAVTLTNGETVVLLPTKQQYMYSSVRERGERRKDENCVGIDEMVENNQQ